MEEIHLNKKEIKEFNKFVSSLWSKISQKIDNISFIHYANELYKINLLESKEHDNFRALNIERGISLNEEAKYFCVLRLIQYSFNFECYKPKIEDFFSIKKSLFYSYAIALNYSDKIKEVITLEEAEKINKISYTQLI